MAVAKCLRPAQVFPQPSNGDAGIGVPEASWWVMFVQDLAEWRGTPNCTVSSSGARALLIQSVLGRVRLERPRKSCLHATAGGAGLQKARQLCWGLPGKMAALRAAGPRGACAEAGHSTAALQAFAPTGGSCGYLRSGGGLRALPQACRPFSWPLGRQPDLWRFLLPTAPCSGCSCSAFPPLRLHR